MDKLEEASRHVCASAMWDVMARFRRAFGPSCSTHGPRQVRRRYLRRALADEATESRTGSGGYPFAEVESRWQRRWAEEKTFRTPKEVRADQPKMYVLDMFPYPSGSGLHVGHPEGYTATDIVARYKRMQGYNVLHPMGWDSFGLPAEQFAIQTGTHPAVTTQKNIQRFKEQLQSLGFSYDWEREIATTDPKYYKWTQWIFIQLLKHGLAYQAEVPVNWCPALGTVLANEEVIDGKSERGGHPVIRKPMKQWMLRITAYADRLLEDLEELEWPESIKVMQRNWIGRSEGAEIQFKLANSPEEESLLVYTTRPDTLFGATYMVVAPEHPMLERICSEEQKVAVNQYTEAAALKSELERQEISKDKTGVFTGGFAINPATGKEIPIWVADYVIGGYGSGAIMAVPAHDSRDHEFATAFGLPVVQVVESENEMPFDGEGTMMNSSSEQVEFSIDGMNSKDARLAVIEWLEAHGHGNKKVNYKLRDWLFARQRYWGEPFPVVFEDGSGNPLPISEDELPLTLPEMESFQPTGNGDPPLAKATGWVNTTAPGSNQPAIRETNTMPQWAGSCWYYLRYIDPTNDDMLISPELEKYWMPVDLYVGGAEHSVLHLLYARFWHKFLYDLGVVTTKEPFQRLVNQGMILGETEYTTYVDEDGKYVSSHEAEGKDGYKSMTISDSGVKKKGSHFVLAADETVRVSARAHKMSKSRGNVINPDDIVKQYGADSLRLYEMFMGPLQETKVWSTRSVDGVHRFLARFWRLFEAVDHDAKPSDDQMRTLHKTIDKVTKDTEELRFNTAISAMMEFVNEATKWNTKPAAAIAPLALLLSPYAPHISEEIWSKLGHQESLAYHPWPEAEEKYLVDSTIQLPVQVMGKMKGLVVVAPSASESEVLEAALSVDKVASMVDGKSMRKVIYKPGKILNLIIG